MNFQPLKDYLDFYVSMLGVPGSDIVVYKNSEEVFRYQSGYDSLAFRTPVRDNALYNLFSCTKVALAVAALQLIERGEILATDPVYAYFPEYRELNVKKCASDGSVIDIVPAKNVMTIHHLLTMTACMNYDLNSPTIQAVKTKTEGRCPTLDIVRAIAKEPLCFEPGKTYNYGLCHDVVGGIIELVSGMKLGEYMQKNIFEPLGMKETTFSREKSILSRLACHYDYDEKNKCAVEIPPEENPYVFGTEYESAGAGLISSVDDYILLAEALTNFGVGRNGERILSKRGINLMRANQLDAEALVTFNHLGYGYGYGVRTNINPSRASNLSTVGEFGWQGREGSYFSSDPDARVSIFYAQHMMGMNHMVHPRLRNVVYSCLED